MKKLIIFLFASSVIIFSSTLPYAQEDNPNLDRIPQKFVNFPKVYSPNTVETIGDYDNFNMGYDYSEGHVSANPRNPLWYFCAYNTNGAHYTINGWDFFNSTVGFPSVQGDPWTAYDSLGNLYYQNMKYPITGCWVAKSSNNGQSWIYTNMTCVAGVDKNAICAVQSGGPYSNFVYCTMTTNTGGSFWRSTDVGATFAQTNVLASQTLPGMMSCVGPNGSIQGGCVYAVTHSGTNSAGVYTFYKSTNGGLNFTNVSTLSVSGYIGTEVSGRSTVGVMRTRPYPMITSDNSWGPYRGRLYLVWASNDPPGNGNKSDIWIKYSADQGSTWSATMRINDDVNPQNNHSFFPAIWCEKETGKLYVEYYDTRLCPTSDSMDVYATYSTTGGASFAPSQRLTNKTFKIDLPGNTAPSYQGDYFSITANNKVGLAIWNDFRNANASSIGSFSAYFPDFGMRLSPFADSLNQNGSVTIQMQVPGVKLYSDTVVVSAAITPAPATGTLTISYPTDNKLTSFPGFVPVKITASGNVTSGLYTLEVTAKGPNGTPIHKRTSTIKVTAPLPVTLKVYLEGFWSGTTQVVDTAKVYLANTITPNTFVDSGKVVLSTSGTASISFSKIMSGNYYIVVRHRNHLETWSKLPQTLTSGVTLNYDFTTAATQAYGNNMNLAGSVWVLIGGDINQDGIIDALDRSLCWNDRNLSGYYASDVNGDGVVDALDRSICWNNRNLSLQKPALAASPGKVVKKGDTKYKSDLKLDGLNSKEAKKNK